MRAVVTRVGTGAVLLAVLAGCGVTTSGQASTAGPERVPYDLLALELQTTTTTVPGLAGRTVQVWLVADDRVVPVQREVATPVGIVRLLAALVAGPTDGEAALGVRSALPGSEVVLEASVDDGLATIDLGSEFADARSREQLFALAQLVYTATSLPEVYAVAFELDGIAVDVTSADGSISDGPVTRFDYLPLVVEE